MYRIYESTITASPPFINIGYTGDAKIKSNGTISLPSDCVYITLINMSPFKIGISLSGGALDEYIEPNAKKENIYIGKQGGTDLTVGHNLQIAATISLTSVNVPNGVTQVIGDLTILGKKVNENWQKVLPLTSGSVAPILGGNVTLTSISANEIIFPSPDNWTVQESGGGDLVVTDTTTNEATTFGRDGSFNIPVVAVVKQALGGANRHYFVISPSDGHAWGIQEATDDSLRFVDETSGFTSCIMGNAFGIGGPVFTINGQSVVGNLGVTAIPALTSSPVNYTATTLQQILSFTPTVSGIYRAGIHAAIAGAGGATITADVTFTDSKGHNGSNIFTAWQTGTTIIGLLAAAYNPTRDVIGVSQGFWAASGTAIVVRYQNSTGTPNDDVTAYIERLQ